MIKTLLREASQMIKILVPSASYILTDHLLSSEGTFCYTLFQKLEKFGYHFEAISAQVRVKKPLDNVTFHKVGSLKITPSSNLIWKYLSHTEFLTRSYIKSVEILQSHNIDIIHHMLPAVYGQTFNLLALFGKTESHPFVFGPASAHFYPRPPDERILLKLTSKLHKETIRKCDALVTITDQVKGLYAKMFDVEKIITIPLGIDADLFKPSKKPSFKEHYEILFAGYLYKLKGLEFLIKAFHIIAQERKDVRLRVVGDGPQKQQLIKLAQKLKIDDKIIFQGFVPYNKMPQYYQQCDIFCFPTLGEPFGKAVIEAMACAKPVVASNVGGPKEIIQNKKTGILVQSANPKILAQEILNLLNDEKTMKTIGVNARKTVLQKYSWPKIAEKYHKLYKSLI